MKHSFTWLLHNCALHPIAGVLWFFGFDALAEKVHQAIVVGSRKLATEGSK